MRAQRSLGTRLLVSQVMALFIYLFFYSFLPATDMIRNDKIAELLQQRQEKDARQLNKVSP